MELEACVCSLWPVHRSSTVGWRAGYLQTSHCSLRDQCRNAESGQVALQVALCWRPEALLPRKGWKTHRGKQYNSWCDLVGHKHGREPKTTRSMRITTKTPTEQLWPHHHFHLRRRNRCEIVCSLTEKVTQLSLIGNAKLHDWSSQVTSVYKSMRSTNLNVKQENSGWQSWTYRLLGKHV